MFDRMANYRFDWGALIVWMRDDEQPPRDRSSGQTAAVSRAATASLHPKAVADPQRS